MPYPDLACLYKAKAMQAEHLDGGTSDGSSAHNMGAGETAAQVIMPVVCARIAKRYDATGARVKSSGVGWLVIVAPEAAQAQVVAVVRAAARCGDAVINSARVSRIVHA